MQDVIKTVDRWLQQCVLGLSLCPYAKAPMVAGKVRIVECESLEKKTRKSAQFKRHSLTEEDFLLNLEREIETLLNSPEVETTLLIGQGLFTEFLDFNDFVGDVERQLRQQGIDEYLQLASFHPGWLFAGEDRSDASNYTNRAPYPIVQLLRVDSVAEVVESGDTMDIPARNITRLRALDKAQLEKLFPWVARE